MPGMDRPEQWQVVVAVPGGHGFALLGQRLDTALLREKLPDLAPERGVGFLRLRRLEHLAEDADQGFLDSPVLIVQGLQLLLGRGLRSPDRGAASSRSVRRDSACAPDAAGLSNSVCRLPGWAMSRRSPTSSAAASAANWRSLVWAMPSRSGSGSIRPVSQSSRSIQSLIVFGVAGPGVCLRRLKPVVSAVRAAWPAGRPAPRCVGRQTRAATRS